MTERLPSPEQRHHFNSVRDEALYDMSVEAWCTESMGDSSDQHGWFALIENFDFNLEEIAQAFEEHAWSRGDLQPIIGNFIVHENRHKQVTVYEFDTFQDARAAYNGMAEVLALYELAKQGPTYDQEDRCAACGAHIAEPHAVDCPVGGEGAGR